MIKQWIYFAMKNMKYRRLRAYLTMLGIIIGVAALVSLITLGQSLENSVTSQFSRFGSNILWIGPESANAFGPPKGKSGLTMDDAEFVGKISKVDYTLAMQRESLLVKYDQEKKVETVVGFDSRYLKNYFEDIKLIPEKGRLIERGERNIVIVGNHAARMDFDKEVRLKNKIEINGKKFEVVGLLEEQGGDMDHAIIMNIDDIWEITENKEKRLSAFSAVLPIGVDPDLMSSEIEKKLERKRGVDDFQVTNPKKIASQITEILGVVRYVLLGIVMVSLFVGGLGIMNSMYTSVLERTRDIGIMKAVGASKGTILTMYLIESGILGLLGGLIGVIIGILIAKGIEFGLGLYGFTLLKIEISFVLVIFGLGFSFVVGVVSGMLPAKRAASMDPLEALRYE